MDNKCFGEQPGVNPNCNPYGAYVFEIDGLAFSIHDLPDC